MTQSSRPCLPKLTLRLLFTWLSEFRALRSLIALLTLRGLRYKIFLRDALFSPQMPAASPKLFACYIDSGDTQTCALKVAKILSDDPVRVAPTKRRWRA